MMPRHRWSTSVWLLYLVLACCAPAGGRAGPSSGTAPHVQQQGSVARALLRPDPAAAPRVQQRVSRSSSIADEDGAQPPAAPVAQPDTGPPDQPLGPPAAPIAQPPAAPVAQPDTGPPGQPAEQPAAPISQPDVGPPGAGGAPPAAPGEAPARPWLNASLPLEQRVASLLAALTVDEKAGLMIHGQAGVERLGLKPFQFWNECLHGHQERYSGALPTIFPQPLMLAATFDPRLAHQVFTAISDELRAKSNAELSSTGIHKFLTCWTPHINLFKDPRWGRGSETFGEDPQLTAAMARAIVAGLQGDEPGVAKVVATCKHWLGYGLEGAEGVSRYNHNYDVTPQDLADTELPPFEACIQAAHARGIMCSYNAVNGEPACASRGLLQGLLRSRLGFDGYIVSDCNAVQALTWGHGSAADIPAAVGAAVRAGVDMLCDRPEFVKMALAAGSLTEADLDASLTKTLGVRFATGQFDPPSANPWAGLPLSLVNSKAHRRLARSVVHKGIVLLKNSAPPGATAPLLPLRTAALSKVCVLGPLADSVEHLMGNYYGKFDGDATLTPRAAIERKLAPAGVQVAFHRGMDVTGEIHYDWPLESALQACANASVGIVVVGSSMIELARTPDGSFKPATEGEGLDRLNLDLPGRQGDLIKALARRLPALPLVVALVHGGGLDVGWLAELPSVHGLLSVPFPGQEGGSGLVDVLFGTVSPSGRLPITWYRNNYTAAVSPLDLRMRPDAATRSPGRSYRFLSDAAASSYVLYPFGHGLSYTAFSYSRLHTLAPGEHACPGDLLPAPALCLEVTVTNEGGASGEHVVPLYLSHTLAKGTDGNPQQSLRGFARTRELQPGDAERLTFPLTAADFSLPRASDGTLLLAPGPWRASLGTWDAPTVAEPAPPPPPPAAAATAGGSGDALAPQGPDDGGEAEAPPLPGLVVAVGSAAGAAAGGADCEACDDAGDGAAGGDGGVMVLLSPADLHDSVPEASGAASSSAASGLARPAGGTALPLRRVGAGVRSVREQGADDGVDSRTGLALLLHVPDV